MNDSCKGFSLIEVMVAVFVFATGILSLASLQVQNLSLLGNSHSMSVAMTAVNDMADRMRANPVAIFNGAYDAIDGSETDPQCASTCSYAEIAQYDAFAVRDQLDGLLVEPTLTVTNQADNVFLIEITWTERLGDSSETKTHSAAFIPYKPRAPLCPYRSTKTVEYLWLNCWLPWRLAAY